MKRERKARKDLNDLYFYMDMQIGYAFKNQNDAMVARFNKIKDKFKNKFKDRYFYPNEWREYYGLFEFGKGKIGIDPKRFIKSTNYYFSDDQLKIMNSRKTTYFHPKKNCYEDYYANVFKNAINELIDEFNNVTKPMLKNETKRINGKRKKFTPGDIDLYMQGIYDSEEANMSATRATLRNEIAVKSEIMNLNVSILTQFIHYMVSRIDSLSISIYKRIHPKMKKWSRDLLYNHKNEKNIDCRKLAHFDSHNKMYLIWNFIKHGDPKIYLNLKEKYPEVLYDEDYKSGKHPKYYIKLSTKLILDLLNGTKEYFVEWFEANCDENRDEITWNYSDYFLDIVYDKIEMLRNPLGLEF